MAGKTSLIDMTTANEGNPWMAKVVLLLSALDMTFKESCGFSLTRPFGLFAKLSKGFTPAKKITAPPARWAGVGLELDGSQYLEQEEYDYERTNYLEAPGYQVICFWNGDVMNNIEAVILSIQYVLKERS